MIRFYMTGSTNQMTGFYTKCNAGPKWFKWHLQTVWLSNEIIIHMLTFNDWNASEIEQTEKVWCKWSKLFYGYNQ